MLKEGTLMKCSDYLGQWRSRYFRLVGSELRYYEASEKGVDEVKGPGLNLVDDTPTSVTFVEGSATQFCVRTGSASWSLDARNWDERWAWANALLDVGGAAMEVVGLAEAHSTK